MSKLWKPLNCSGLDDKYQTIVKSNKSYEQAQSNRKGYQNDKNVIINEMNNEIVTHLYYIISNDDYEMCVSVSSQQ